MRKVEVVITHETWRVEGPLSAESVGGLERIARERAVLEKSEVDREPLNDFIDRLLLKIEDGFKIEAIKMWRDTTDMGLLESKKVIDRICQVGMVYDRVAKSAREAAERTYF